MRATIGVNTMPITKMTLVIDGPRIGNHQDGDDDEREGQERIDDAHHDVVGDPSIVAGEKPDEDSAGDPDRRGERARR